MAGMPGRSGGARPGAGRKPKPRPDVALNDEDDPLKFLIAVMHGTIVPTQEQLKAATVAAQYVHAKKEGTKKEEAAKKAAAASGGRFAAAKAPLKLVNGS